MDATNPPPTKRFIAAATLGYLLLAVVYFWPMILNLRSETPRLGLSYAVISNAELMADQLARGESPLTIPRVWYPLGYTIHEGFLPSLMVLVLGFGTWPLLGLNLSILISYVLAGLGACLLAREFTTSRAGAFLAGVYFAFSAPHLANLAVYPIRPIEWLAWFALALIAWTRRRQRKSLVLLAFAFLAASLSSWYFAVLCGLLCSLWGLAVWIGERQVRPLLAPALVLGLCCVLLVPFTPTALLSSDGLVNGGMRFIADSSADFLSFFMPPPRHWALGDAVRAWQTENGWVGSPALRANYFGTVLFLLALGGVGVLWRRGRMGKVLLLTGLLGWILALGPYLAVNGLHGWTRESMDLPDAVRMPYFWLAEWFPFSVTRATGRYALLTFLALGVALAAAYERLEARASGRRWRAALAGVISVVLLAELSPKWPQISLQPLRQSAFHHTLGTMDGEFSVLELPFKGGAYRNLYYTLTHDKNVIGGAIDKPSARFTRVMRGYPLLMTLLRASNNPQANVDDLYSDVFGESAQEYSEGMLNALGVRYAIVHRYDEQWLSYRSELLLDEPSLAAMRATVRRHFEPHTAEELVEVFARDLSGDWLFPVLDSAWGHPQVRERGTERWLDGAVGKIAIVSSQTKTVTLEVEVRWPTTHTLSVLWNGQEIARGVQANRFDEFETLRFNGLVIEGAEGTEMELRLDSVPVGDGEDTLVLHRFEVLEE